MNKLDSEQKKELTVAGFFLIPPIYALWEINTSFVAQNTHTGGGAQNAALFPGIISIVLLVFVGIKIINTLLNNGLRKPDKISITHMSEKEVKRHRSLMLYVFFTFAIYLISLGILGYYLATPLAMAALFRILGLKRFIPLVLLSIGVTLTMWYVFSELLRIVLPVGIFGIYL